MHKKNWKCEVSWMEHSPLPQWSLDWTSFVWSVTCSHSSHSLYVHSTFQPCKCDIKASSNLRSQHEANTLRQNGKYMLNLLKGWLTSTYYLLPTMVSWLGFTNTTPQMDAERKDSHNNSSAITAGRNTLADDHWGTPNHQSGPQHWDNNDDLQEQAQKEPKREGSQDSHYDSWDGDMQGSISWCEPRQWKKDGSQKSKEA